VLVDTDFNYEKAPAIDLGWQEVRMAERRTVASKCYFVVEHQTSILWSAT
jgi:hypothetical protein